jgi:nitroreductase
MFMQTFMLLAREKGLHTCALWSNGPAPLAHFEHAGEWMLFCGMALGYRNETHPINSGEPSARSLQWQGCETAAGAWSLI